MSNSLHFLTSSADCYLDRRNPLETDPDFCATLVEMQLSDLITPTTPAGAALFLRWKGYHVFSVPQRELSRSPHSVRFFGVGGKRQNPDESFVDCALRESAEEIGEVVSQVESARQTDFLKADGTIARIQLTSSTIQPRLILEKRNHSGFGSMSVGSEAYYLVAFNASLLSQPKPSSEIAAILYLNDVHLSLMRFGIELALADLVQAGAYVECRTGLSLDNSTILVPHGTARFLVQQNQMSIL